INLSDSLKIERDKHGLFHINSESEKDLYKGLGYCHALDRGMQILLLRILGKGKASELLESSDELLEIDKFFRKMNFAGNLKEELSKLEAKSIELCESYCEGINEALNKKYPWEFKLVGYKPEPWTIEDSIMISRITGYITLAQSQHEIERLFIQMLQNNVELSKLKELFPNNLEGLNDDLIELIKKVKVEEKVVPDAVKWNHIVPKMLASNNWVISGSKTKSGKPILANDPHLETNRLPNIWYEVVLNSSEQYAIATSMPGLPGVLLGRTKYLSWGATYTFMDSVDSFIEDCKDGKYLREGEYLPFKERKEIIKRKNKESVEITFYENDLGVLDGNPFDSGFYLNTKWFPIYSGSKAINNIIKMWQAKTVQEGMSYLGNLETSWNWVLADTSGNIAYQMSGMMPKRKEGYSGFYPLPSWNKENHVTEFYPLEDLPRCINPKEGYFVTANNNLNSYGKVSPINICMADYRSDRIKQLLDSKDKIEPEDCFKMHYDVYSIQAEKYMKILLPLLPDNEKGKILKNWDYKYDLESKGAYLFERVYKKIIIDVFGSTFGKEVIKNLLEESGIVIDFYGNIDSILLSENSTWFNGKSRNEIYQKAIIDALNKTEIKAWKEVNTITLSNIFFNNKMLELSKKIKFEKGIGFYYYNHIFLFDENQPQKAIMYVKKASLLF
ncbi:MAG: penicillin acylase family protein, partial [Candidatus Sericytochromatia bacterium]